jgi:hypothetical protein
MDESTVMQELQKYNITDAAIAKLKTDYLALAIKNFEDKDGFKKVHEARMDVVKRRTSVEKTRKELKEESLKFGRAVDAEAKRITALLEPIETHLTTEEKKVTDELARRKAEEEAREAARVQARINKLYDLDCKFDGIQYSRFGIIIPAVLIKSITDEQFEKSCADIQTKIDEEAARLAEEEAKRKAEQERLAKIAAEQDAERKRLEEVARKQAEEAARIKAEQEERERKIREAQAAIEREEQRLIEEEAARLAAEDRERKRTEDEKCRAEELKNARQQECAKARKEMLLAVGYQYPLDDLGSMTDLAWTAMYDEHRKAWDKKKNDELAAELKAGLEREAEMEAERQRLAKIAAEKKAARAPDKVKILAWIKAFNDEHNPPPSLKTAEAIEIIKTAKEHIEIILQEAEQKAEAL